MHYKQKALSLLLAAAMVLSLVPAAALAAAPIDDSTMVESSETQGVSAIGLMEQDDGVMTLATDRAPTTEELASISYSFVGGYQLTASAEHDMLFNGTVITTSRTVDALTLTKSGTAYKVLFFSMQGSKKEPQKLVGGSEWTYDNPTVDGLNPGQFDSTNLQVDIPGKLDDLHIDGNGRIYYIFTAKFGDNTPTKYYLGPNGFTTETSGLPTVKLNVALTAGANSSITTTNGNQTIEMGSSISDIVVTPASGYAMPDANDSAWTMLKSAGLTVTKDPATGAVTISGAPTQSVTGVTLPSAVVNTWNVQLTAGANSSITSNNGTQNIVKGQSIATITVKPDADYLMPATWENNTTGLTYTQKGSGASAEITGTPTKDITATLPAAVINVWKINLTAPTHTTITGNIQKVTKDDALNPDIVITPDTGYVLSAVTGNGDPWQGLRDAGLMVTAGADGKVTISGKPNKDIASSMLSGISATPKPYALTVPEGNRVQAATGTASGVTGGSVTLTPKDGFVLSDDATVKSAVSVKDKDDNTVDASKYTVENGAVKFTGTSVGSDYTITVDDKAFSIKNKTGVDRADGTGYIKADVAAGTKYAVTDKNGAPIPGVKAYDKDGNELTTENGGIDANGWAVCDPGKGPIKFAPIPAGSEAKLVSTTAGDTVNQPTSDSVQASGTTVGIPAIGNNAYGGVDTDPGHAGKTTITIDPADPNLKYGLIDESGSPVGGWSAGGESPVTFDNLSPDKKYTVVAKPAIGDESTIAQKKDTGVAVTTPHAETDSAKSIQDVTAPDVSRQDGTGGKDKIVVDPTVKGQEYAVLDKDGNEVGSWKKSEDGEALTFDGLDPNGDYTVVTRTPASGSKEASLPTKGVEVPHTTVKPNEVTTGTDSDGKAVIIVEPTDPNTKYAVVDTNTGKVVPMPTDKDGWLTGGGKLEFPGLNAGGNYQVITWPKDQNGLDRDPANGGNTPQPDGDSPYPNEPGGVVGPTKKIPAVSADQLTGTILKEEPNKGQTAVTIEPTDPNLSYAIVDGDGNIVTNAGGEGGWQKGEDGSVTFSPLKPGEKYEVIAVPTADPKPAGNQKDKGTTITTPKADTAQNQVIDRVNNAPDSEGTVTDKITVNPTDANLDYAVIDTVTGKVVAPVETGSGSAEDGWQQGNSGELAFDGLDPNRKYELVTRPHTTDGSLPVVNLPGVVVDKVGLLELSGKVVDKNSAPVPNATVKVTVATTDGGFATLTAKTDSEGRYTLKGENIKLPGDYTIYVDSTEGVASSTQPITKKQPQELADIVAKKAAEGNTNIAGGVVSGYGEPEETATVVIRDKQTGEKVTAPAGSVTETKDGGGYTVENLPDGVYIVETSKNSQSGMTEIKVQGGKVVPNTEGGYKNTNVPVTNGDILKGKVEGLKAGEKATVSLNVPIYDKDNQLIGTKTVTAVAEGPGGYWQIAGVPGNGAKYPVTVTTPNGSLTGTIQVATGGAVSTVTPGEGVPQGSMDKGDVTSEHIQGLVIKVPETKPAKPNVITGAVVDSENKPVNNAAVTIYNDKGEAAGTAITGTGGGYTVPNDLPDGKYYISAGQGGKNGLAGPIEIKNGKTTGKTNVTVSDTASELLEGTVTKEGSTSEKPIPAAGATVVVKDKDGNVITTTKANSNGQYFVGSVPADATVTIVTPDGETAHFTVSDNNGTWSGDKTTAKPAAGAKPIVGPNGDKLAPVINGNGTTQTKLTVADKDGNNASGKFDVDASGNLVAKTGDNKPAAGTYTVTVEQNGMKVTETITVNADGVIADSKPITIQPHTVKGTVEYSTGNIPADAVISIPGWGEAKVNPKTGTYELAGIPDGEYTAKLTVKDAGGTDSEITATLKVEKGVMTFIPGGDASTGANVTAEGPALTVTPTSDVTGIDTAISNAEAAINAAQDDPSKLASAITAVKSAQDALTDATEEEIRQLDKDAGKSLTDALLALMDGDLTVAAKAEGVQNTTTVQETLDGLKGFLVSEDELKAAATTLKAVDVSLTLKADDVTNEPTSAVSKDIPKVESVASAVGADETALYEIVVKKTTKVTETVVEGETTVQKPISETTTQVTALPNPVTLTLTIPGDLLGFQYYAVIRVHSGTAQRIPSTVNGNTITVSSSLYSTYAILASNDPMFDDDVKADNGNQGGNNGSTGGGVSTTVKVEKTEDGKVKVDKPSAGAGQTVIITVTPDPSYELGQLTVTDKKGNELELKDLGNGKYSFVMPKDKPVTVTATFVETGATGDPNTNGVAKLLIVDDHIAYMKGDNAGNFRPNGSITRAETAQLFYNLLKDQAVRGSKTFSDVSSNAWYATAVNALANLGIVEGVGEGRFDPDRAISRAEFVTIAMRFATNVTGTKTFTDVDEGYWAYDYITGAAYYGWINGYEDGSFKPVNPIARAEAATVVNNMLNREGDKAFIDKAEDLKLFPDVPATSWAFYEIVEATNAHDFTRDKDGVENWK